MDELLAEFLAELNESLAVLDVQLVALEREADDPERLRNIFRLIHTIKGTCGFFGLPRLEAVAHAVENVLGRLRDATLPVTPAVVGLLLEALDRIKLLLEAIEQMAAEPPGHDGDLIMRLDGLADGAAAPRSVVASNGTKAQRDSDAAHTIRVDIELLDALMATVGELVLTRNQLVQASRPNADLVPALQRLDEVAAALREGVMQARMQPIGKAWAKLPRLVRDLGHELGKRIELSLRGGEIRLDRQLVDLIRDPLMHMVRNSADHGIEPPAERRRLGKSETGRISLSAAQQGSAIVIEIADDGRGLSLARLRQKAIEDGLASPAELAGMSDPQVSQLIFKPGFSTASRVTNVSGRGVGMDIVRTNIEKVGGTIELRTDTGRGTAFRLRVPLTLGARAMPDAEREPCAPPQAAAAAAA